MLEFKTENGITVVINSSPFVDAMNLKSVILKEIAKAGFKLDSIDFQKEMDSGLIGSIVQSLLLVDSSKEFHDAVFKCLLRCTYNREKITEQTFESNEARQDYYQIVISVVKENLSPFLKGLVSSLKKNDVLGSIIGFPK